jgi:type IV secretion system protein VirD4
VQRQGASPALLRAPSCQAHRHQVRCVRRALLLPQEVIQLPRDEEIILIESFAPVKCKKIFYFKDSFFTKRLLPPIKIPQQEPYDPRKKKKSVAFPTPFP